MGVKLGDWFVGGGHYKDEIVSSSGQGKCTFDIEKSWQVTDFWQSNRRESTSLTSSGSYWDSSTWTYLEFEPKNSKDNCETSYAERRAPNTHTGHFTVIISKRFHFFVVLELHCRAWVWYATYLAFWIRNLGREKKNAVSFHHLLFGSVFRQYSS